MLAFTSLFLRLFCVEHGVLDTIFWIGMVGYIGQQEEIEHYKSSVMHYYHHIYKLKGFRYPGELHSIYLAL